MKFTETKIHHRLVRSVPNLPTILCFMCREFDENVISARQERKEHRKNCIVGVNLIIKEGDLVELLS